MPFVFDKISDDLGAIFLNTFIPQAADESKSDFVADGVALLLNHCKTACPSTVWDQFQEGPGREEIQELRVFLRDSEDHSSGRWQLTLSDVEDGQAPGSLTRFLRNGHKQHVSSFAKAVENAVADQQEDVSEWARWYLIMGYLGLVVLHHIRPITVKWEHPAEEELLKDNDTEDTEQQSPMTIYCVGIDDRIYFYFGLKSGTTFYPLAEWN